MSSTNKQPISDLWRTHKSADAGIELASVLDACQIIAQSVIPQSQVTFAGVKTAATDLQRIYLSPKVLETDEYPVAGDKVDVILGLTVHEVGHILFTPDLQKLRNDVEHKLHLDYRNYNSDFTNLQANRRLLNSIIRVMEDIYVDHLMTAYPGYRDYLHREREYALGEFDVDAVLRPLTTDNIDCTDLLNVIIYTTLVGGQFPTNITPTNLDRLSKIFGYINGLCTKQLAREKAIIGVWNVFKSIPQKVDHSDLAQQRQQEKQAEQDSVAGESPNQQAPDEPIDDGKQPEDNDEPDDGGEDDESQSDTTEETSHDEPDAETEAEPDNAKTDDDGENDADGGNEPDREPTESDTELPDAEENGLTNDEPPPVPLEPWEQPNLASKLDDIVDDQSELSPDLAESVQDAMSGKTSDISQMVSYLAKDSNATVVAYTPDRDDTITANVRQRTSVIEEKLRRILQDYRLKQTKDYRGMLSGRVSSRRLHRVGYGDQRVFQLRQRPDEIDMCVDLLMDLSGSVGCHYDLISELVVAMTDAFTKEKIDFIANGYSDIGKRVYIPRMYNKESGVVNLIDRQRQNKVWGGTPSYEGLAAAEAELLKFSGNKKKVLFHFTDGAPNGGHTEHIPQLIQDMRDKGFVVINICLSSTGQLNSSFKAYYGEDSIAISDISQLPDILDKELRKQLKMED